jgi:hypothetical protein
MDYEKKYKEALERAKYCLTTDMDDSGHWAVKHIFPELKESEDDDERIRTGLINGFNECLKNSQYPKNAQKYWHNIKIENILAWLEKQSDKDKQVKELGKYKVKYTQEVLSQQLEKQREKPIDWSEEDEKMLVDCFNILHRSDYPTYKVTKIVNWLKALKKRYTWKPNDEQIKAIRLARFFVVDDFSEHPTLSEILIELEKQLQKIKENKI